MVQSTIGLAHSLGRKVVAEGVEHRDILDVLVEMDCDIAQGFAIGRPMSLESLISASRPTASAAPPNALNALAEQLQCNLNPNNDPACRASGPGALIMVNRLLTISIKVNMPSTAESQLEQRGTKMKKTKAGRGFWSWLLGRRLGKRRIQRLRSSRFELRTSKSMT